MLKGKVAPQLSAAEENKLKKRINVLFNHARFDEVEALVVKLRKAYPDNVYLAYTDAVITAENTIGFTPAQNAARYRLAAKKLKYILDHLPVDPAWRGGLLNELYWFSKQPRKQYALGVREAEQGHTRGGFYSQGVGAAQIARGYGLKGKRALCVRWASRAESAWLNFFREDAAWSNSYYFYAVALGYQGKSVEMEKALRTYARLAKKPLSWEGIVEARTDVAKVLKRLGKSTAR